MAVTDARSAQLDVGSAALDVGSAELDVGSAELDTGSAALDARWRRSPAGSADRFLDGGQQSEGAAENLHVLFGKLAALADRYRV